LEMLYGWHIRDHAQQIKSELQSLTKSVALMEDYLHKTTSLALVLRGAGKPMEERWWFYHLLT
jgi:hypothetical protein